MKRRKKKIHLEFREEGKNLDEIWEVDYTVSDAKDTLMVEVTRINGGSLWDEDIMVEVTGINGGSLWDEMRKR